MVSGGGGNSENQSVDLTPNVFRSLRTPLAQALAQFINPVASTFVGSPVQQATASAQGSGGLAAPVTGQQQDIINQIVGAAGNDTLTGSASNLLNKTIQGDYLTPDSNPFLQAMFEAAKRPLTSEFEDVIVPQLLSRFTGAGQQVQGTGSSAFALQANRAAEAQGKAVGDLAANIFGPAYEAERQRQTQAITQATQLSTDQVNRLMSGLQAASLPQLTQDLGIQRGLEAYQLRVSSLLQALQTLAGVTAPNLGQHGESSQFQFGIFS